LGLHLRSGLPWSRPPPPLWPPSSPFFPWAFIPTSSLLGSYSPPWAFTPTHTVTVVVHARPPHRFGDFILHSTLGIPLSTTGSASNSGTCSGKGTGLETSTACR
jgi:hypothetical protein